MDEQRERFHDVLAEIREKAIDAASYFDGEVAKENMLKLVKFVGNQMAALAQPSAQPQSAEPAFPDWAPMPNPTDADLMDPVFEAIWQVVKTWDVNVPQSYNGYCGASGSHVMLILNAVRAAHPQRSEPAQGWISVEDRLPPNTKAVLVWESTYQNTYTAFWRDNEWRFFGGLSDKMPIYPTHWQPLPAAPKPVDTKGE